MADHVQCPNCHVVHPVAAGSRPGAGTIFMVAVVFILTLANAGMIFYMWRYFYAVANAFG